MKELVYYWKKDAMLCIVGTRIGCSYVKCVYVFNAFYYISIFYALKLWYLLKITVGNWTYIISLAFIKQQFWRV
jgi:hypothetical protein